MIALIYDIYVGIKINEIIDDIKYVEVKNNYMIIHTFDYIKLINIDNHETDMINVKYSPSNNK